MAIVLRSNANFFLIIFHYSSLHPQSSFEIKSSFGDQHLILLKYNSEYFYGFEKYNEINLIAATLD